MNTKFKQGLKAILQGMGLLSFCDSIIRWAYKIRELFSSLKLYLFNGLLTFVPNHFMRVFYLRNIAGVRIGRLCFIHMGARFEGNIIIGDNSVIGRKCVLLGDITIKNNVSITAETYIFTSSHIIDSPTFGTLNKPVMIEDYAWIGARAIIFPGVRIGKGAVLGAASTATKDIPDYSVFAGVPAKEIGKRSELLEYTLAYFPFFQ
jgi:maltose O-acetyltransferase